jgi:hypothetical protein
MQWASETMPSQPQLNKINSTSLSGSTSLTPDGTSHQMRMKSNTFIVNRKNKSKTTSHQVIKVSPTASQSSRR